MRKIILNLAISLDGFISDKDGGFAWIGGHGDNTQNTENQFDFPKFMNDCDTVVMGRKAYDDCGIKDVLGFEEKMFYVATSKKMENLKNVTFINGDIVKIINDLKEKEGKNIWLFGGSGLTDDFVKADIVDEYIIGIIPTIRGVGTKLFPTEYPVINLELKECTVNDGITILWYTKRK